MSDELGLPDDFPTSYGGVEDSLRPSERCLPPLRRSRVERLHDTEAPLADRPQAVAALRRRPIATRRRRNVATDEPVTSAKRWSPIHAGRRGLALATVTTLAVIVAATVILNGSPTRPQLHRNTGVPLASTDTSLPAYPPGLAATVDGTIARIAENHVTVHRRHPRTRARHKLQRRHPRPIHHHSSSPAPHAAAAAPSQPVASTGSTSADSTSGGASQSSVASSAGSSTPTASSSQTGSSNAATSHTQTAGPTGPASILGPGTCNC
jgi:hypothetical protein